MPHDDDIITVSTYDAVSAADGDSSILPSGFQELSPVDSPDGNDPGFNYPIQGAGKRTIFPFQKIILNTKTLLLNSICRISTRPRHHVQSKKQISSHPFAH